MADRAQWIWMPHAGHLMVGHWCRFHLNTHVGNYIVSTLGEYVPDETVREIDAQANGVTLEGRGDARLADWLKKRGQGIGKAIGADDDSLYETLIFPAKPSDIKNPIWQCCPFVPASWTEVDGRRYSTATAAYQGHLDLCDEWSKKEEPANG